MFDKETVFILGAGASCHYGYPTGEKLVEMVIEKAQELALLAKNYIEGCKYYNSIPNFDENASYNQHRNTREERSYKIRIKADDFCPTYKDAHFNSEDKQGFLLGRWENFQQDCEKLSQVLSELNPLIIDDFLYWNKGLREIGKFIIAWVILECEAYYKSKQKNIKDDWYRFISHKFVSGYDYEKPKNLLDTKNVNKVKFITFNYDVSLDTHFCNWLKNNEIFINCQTEERDNFIKNNIIHVYGQVRSNFTEKLDFIIDKDEKGEKIKIRKSALEINRIQKQVSWGDEIELPDLRSIQEYAVNFKIASEAVQQIKTIEELKPHNEAAKKAIRAAEEIYILGYGFDERNSERIGLNELVKASLKPNKKIYFTNFNDYNRVNKKIGNSLLQNSGYFTDNFIYNSLKIIEDELLGDTNKSSIAKRQVKQAVQNSPYQIYEKSIKNVYDALVEDFDLI